MLPCWGGVVGGSARDAPMVVAKRMERSGFDEEVRLLSMAETFESLSDEVTEELTRRRHNVRLEPGEVFFTPEDHQERLFLLKEGRVLIYRVDSEGRDIALTVAGGGTIFGEMTPTAQRLREAYAQAIEPCVVFVLGRDDLEDLVRSNPEVGLCLIRQLCERLGQLARRI